MKPKVSICLPVYNGTNYLVNAIESALEQSFSDFELLIGDDLSTDGTADLIADYAKQDKRIVSWRNPEQLGLFGNYNACLDKVQGEFIKLFAHDDILEPNIVARMLGVLEKHTDVSLVSSGKCLIDENGKEIERTKQFSSDCLIPGKEVIIANLILLTNWVGEPSAVMFRASDRQKGFDKTYYHYGDIEYWFRLLTKGNLFYIAEPLCRFRRHQQSHTTASLAGLYFALDIFRLGEKYKGYLAEIGETPEHFSKRAVEKIALEVDHLVRTEDLDTNHVRKAGSDRQLYYSRIEDNTHLREALFHAVRRVTTLMEELIETGNELEHRQAECKRLWAAVNQMTNSVSWKITAPLRTVRGKLARQGDK